MSVSPIKAKTTPVFKANYLAYKEGWPVICNEGGSRSGKTYSIIQLLCGIAIDEPGKRISIVSHSLPHIKRGALRDFKAIMQDIGRWDENRWRATDFVYTFSNGSYIELFGLEDESKARGPGRDILFINEANLVAKMLFDQLAMRTTGTIFMDWNPADFNNWVYNVADEPKNKRIHSTYLDNIHNLSEQQVAYIESYRDLPDPFMWQVYGLGQRGASLELIYTAWSKADLPGKGDVFYGLDFGYTNPTALVKVEHYDGANYVHEMLYLSKVSNNDLIEVLKSMRIGDAFLYCDNAEPDRISELKRAGLNAHPANKDVSFGITKVKSYALHITPGSKNLIDEITSYKWRTDKDGNITDKEEPVKANDHLCDAMRYAITTHLHKAKPVYVGW